MRKDLQFYMDENVPLAVEKGLHLRGVNVLTTQEAGMRQASDKEQLIFAHRHGRVLLHRMMIFCDFMRQAWNMPGSCTYINRHLSGGSYKASF